VSVQYGVGLREVESNSGGVRCSRSGRVEVVEAVVEALALHQKGSPNLVAGRQPQPSIVLVG
jgi:hypothetical protein